MIESRFFRGIILDAVKSARKRGFAYTDFLSEEEQAEAELILKRESDVSFSLFGGYEEAERRVLCVYEDDAPQSWPVSLMDISVRDKTAELKHSDVLGSVMALSVERGVLGDIICCREHASVFILKNMESYFSQNLLRIGKYACDVTVRSEWDEPDFFRKFLELECVISSNRLDCYVSELARLSRNDSVELIREGRVAVNGRTVTAPAMRLNASDKLTIRGKGKFIIESDPANCPATQKGRLRILIKKYN